MEGILGKLQKIFLKSVRLSFLKNYVPHTLWIYQQFQVSLTEIDIKLKEKFKTALPL